MKKIIMISVSVFSFVGIMAVVFASWLPGKGVLWAEYGETTDPVDRYTASTVDGISGYTDSATGLSWATNNQQASTVWSAALTYCTGLGSGWRLPHRDELLSLVNADMYNPATNMPQAVSTSYWLSTEFAGDTSYAWRVNLYYGYVGGSNKTNTYQVVCVHD